MKRILPILILAIVILGCKKDKTTPPCTNVSMVGERETFVGKWRWYKTSVREWFDVGPDIFHDYTPTTEGFEYYFIISENGVFKSYRDNVLENDFLMSYANFEINGEMNNVLTTALNCSSLELSLVESNLNSTDDSVFIYEYPLNFYNEVEQRESKVNYFVRE
jgi:hypothetical protein